VAEASGEPGVVTLAVPCRTDEPALDRTLAAALDGWRRAGRPERLEVLVCVNGGEPGPTVDVVRRFAAAAGAAAAVVDLDAGAELPPASGPLAVGALVTRRAGKAIAWNALRRRAHGARALFVDADVAFVPDAAALLLAALDAHPAAVLAAGKTTCAPRPGAFEAIMAAPYGADFPNLSPQLYAAVVARLPAAMPEDLIEPERWLELTVGPDAIVRVPAARVAVRLPGTLRDFFRQRVRIEMGKVQMARQYPDLQERGTPQPGLGAVLALGGAGAARLGAYLALRSIAHAIAWWRWRRGRTAGVWVQATSTKRWDAAAP
jgi:hypothetical protein